VSPTGSTSHRRLNAATSQRRSRAPMRSLELAEWTPYQGSGPRDRSQARAVLENEPTSWASRPRRSSAAPSRGGPRDAAADIPITLTTAFEAQMRHRRPCIASASKIHKRHNASTDRSPGVCHAYNIWTRRHGAVSRSNSVVLSAGVGSPTDGSTTRELRRQGPSASRAECHRGVTSSATPLGPRMHRDSFFDVTVWPVRSNSPNP